MFRFVKWFIFDFTVIVKVVQRSLLPTRIGPKWALWSPIDYFSITPILDCGMLDSRLRWMWPHELAMPSSARSSSVSVQNSPYRCVCYRIAPTFCYLNQLMDLFIVRNLSDGSDWFARGKRTHRLMLRDRLAEIDMYSLPERPVDSAAEYEQY